MELVTDRTQHIYLNQYKESSSQTIIYILQNVSTRVELYRKGQRQSAMNRPNVLRLFYDPHSFSSSRISSCNCNHSHHNHHQTWNYHNYYESMTDHYESQNKSLLLVQSQPRSRNFWSFANFFFRLCKKLAKNMDDNLKNLQSFANFLQNFHYNSSNSGVFFWCFQLSCIVSCAIAFKVVFEINGNFWSFAKFCLNFAKFCKTSKFPFISKTTQKSKFQNLSFHG